MFTHSLSSTNISPLSGGILTDFRHVQYRNFFFSYIRRRLEEKKLQDQSADDIL